MTSPFGQSSGALMKEKLQAAKELIDTQLELKHIEGSCSPCNSPAKTIFPALRENLFDGGGGSNRQFIPEYILMVNSKINVRQCCFIDKQENST